MATWPGQPMWQPPQAHPSYAPQRQRVHPGLLIAVSAWRLLVVAFGLIGFFAAVADVGDFGDAIPALSQQASLLAAIVYFGLFCYPACTGFRRHEPRSPWLRGAMTVLLLLVGATFLSLLGGDLSGAWSLFEHLLTPLVLLVDWLAVGSNQRNVRWWHPLSWLAFPLAYLFYYNLAGLDIYAFPLSFGDPEAIGYLIGFILGLIAAGYLLYGIGKLRGLIAAQQAPPYGQPQWSPQWTPQQQPYQPPYQQPPYQQPPPWQNRR